MLHLYFLLCCRGALGTLWILLEVWLGVVLGLCKPFKVYSRFGWLGFFWSSVGAC